MLQFFEWYCKPGGSHWNFLKTQVERLVEWGFSHIWLPPAYKGTRGAVSEGYDVYDIFDLGEFDQKGTVPTKYGTKQEYIDACVTARGAGLKILVDVVFNHMGGAEETEKVTVRPVDPQNRNKFIGEPREIEAYTKFTFPGRAGVHSDFVWDQHCFSGIDHAVGEEGNTIYSIVNNYGQSWELMADSEMGNFDYLMLNDLEMRNPEVRAELKKWAGWLHGLVSYDGVRIDAVKHINPSFFVEWLDYLRTEVNPDLFALGEYWLSDDLPVLLNYLELTGERMSLFDAPLHHNLSEASMQREKYDLRTIFNDSLVAAKPLLAVTFVDNHDTQPLQSLEEFTEQWFKPHAYALILLRKGGFPCVFFPDVYGTEYCGQNKGATDCEICIPPLNELPALMDARRYHAYGEQVDYFDDPNCIGWTRAGHPGIPGSGLVVLVSNASATKSKLMRLPEAFSGKELVNIFDAADRVLLNETATGTFMVAPGKVAVWVLSAA
ncbi:MAG: alpha-amylase [Chitinophagaceae bacterium]|nr:MAG: alpha-amylase [Chitinophagaceae bacterium]